MSPRFMYVIPRSESDEGSAVLSSSRQTADPSASLGMTNLKKHATTPISTEAHAEDHRQPGL